MERRLDVRNFDMYNQSTLLKNYLQNFRRKDSSKFFNLFFRFPNILLSLSHILFPHHFVPISCVALVQLTSIVCGYLYGVGCGSMSNNIPLQLSLERSSNNSSISLFLDLFHPFVPFSRCPVPFFSIFPRASIYIRVYVSIFKYLKMQVASTDVAHVVGGSCTTRTDICSQRKGSIVAPNALSVVTAFGDWADRATGASIVDSLCTRGAIAL